MFIQLFRRIKMYCKVSYNLQYQDLYNIPQTAFEDALKEGEVESESEVEEEKEVEFEEEGDGTEFVAADSDESSDEHETMELVCFKYLT